MNPLIIAHRGESYDAPENTLVSINLAWERYADAVEIDIHLTKDNRIVVIHDATTKRTGNISKRIKKSTVEELKKLDVGFWKDKKYSNEKIPTLDEVLKTVPHNKKLIIEIKSDIKTLPFLKNILSTSNLKANQIEIISFNYSIVSSAKKMMPQYKVLYLADLDYNWFSKIISPSIKKLIDKAKKANLDGLNVWAGNLLDQQFIQKVKSENLLLYVWTVNNINKAKILVSWGIDGITTDRAQWLKDKLRLK